MTHPELDGVERSLGRQWRRLAGFVAEWWRVAAHAGSIGTLGLLAIGALLIFSNQARDILSGIGETLTLGGRGMLSPGFRWAGVEAYAMFWLAGLFLALVLSLVVRVAGLLEFDHPPDATQGCDERRRRIVFGYATLIFIGTLSVVHLAYLSGGADVYRAGGIMAIVSAAALVPWFLLNRWKVSLAWRIAVYLVIAILIGGFTLYGTYINTDERIVADMVSCATPALALIAILSGGLPFPARDNRSTGLLIVLASLLSLMVLILMVEAPWPLEMLVVLYKVGSAPVAMIWLAWLASALACCLLVAQLLSPYLGRPDFVVIVIAVGAAFWLHREKPGQEWLGPKPPNAVVAAAAVPLPNAPPAAPKSDRAVAARGGTQLAIHADGGGLRAALYTAEVLAIADDLTCGDFGSHVYAASGVSGGSLGIATWAVMRAELVRLNRENNPKWGDPWADCKQQRENAGIREGQAYWDGPRPLWTLVLDTLLQDHLTAMLTSMLTVDFLRLSGNAQRGQALLDSWQGAALDTLGQIVDPKTRSAFAAKLGESKAGFDRGGPILLFTSTAVDTGERFVFSNANWPPYNAFSNIPIGVAVLDSARFPLFSPAGAILAGGKWRRVADGGYFDNSGAATLRAMLNDAGHLGKLPGKIIVARINGNALNSHDDTRCDVFFDAAAKKGWWVGSFRQGKKKDDKPLPASPPQYSGWSGIDTYEATRSAHAEEAVLSLSHSQMPDTISDPQTPDIVDGVVTPQLRLDYFDGFDRSCAASLPENSFLPVKAGNAAPSVNQPPPCLSQNTFVCLAGRNQRKAPLGWYLSRGSGAVIEASAKNAAERLLNAIHQQ